MAWYGVDASSCGWTAFLAWSELNHKKKSLTMSLGENVSLLQGWEVPRHTL